MTTLPFRLKVPDREEITATGVSSTSFRFHGLLRLREDGLLLTWNGTAQVQRFGLTGIGDDTLPLPEESLELPFERLRAVELQGGWMLPRLLLMGSDFDALRLVPSEEGGRVSLWLDRRDRQLGREVAEAIQRFLRASG